MRAEPRHGFCASSCASQYGKKSHFCIDFRAHNVDIFTCMRVFYILTQIFYHTFFFLVFPFFHDNKKLCFILCVCVCKIAAIFLIVCVCVLCITFSSWFLLCDFFVMKFLCLCVCVFQNVFHYKKKKWISYKKLFPSLYDNFCVNDIISVL